MENQSHYQAIAAAIHYLSERYQEQPSLEEVAGHVHMSKYHFQRLFQKWVGVSPKQFLQYTTVEHAKEQLRRGRSTLAAAYEVGLSGNGRLHDLFVKIEACTPGEFRKRGKDVIIQYARIFSPFGEALVAESAIGICELSFIGEESDEDLRTKLRGAFPEANLVPQLGRFGTMVQAYFSRWEVPDTKIVLDLRGTPFQISIWKALLSIPPAQHLAYQDVARLIDNPKAARAVGTAIGQNPIAYLIPCHRIIRESGDMGGFRWGTDRKRVINGYESANFGRKQIA